MNPRIEKISSILDMNKAENIEVFELIGSDYFADYVVLASSLGERHTIALLDHLKKGLNLKNNFYTLMKAATGLPLIWVISLFIFLPRNIVSNTI